MKALLTAILLLIASTAWAGPEMMLAFTKKHLTVTATAINGISSITEGGTTDTGTGNGSGTGTISVAALCDATGGGSAAVYLVVNGATTDTLSCATGQSVSATFTEAVSGNYTVRVYGTATGAGDFSADTFSFPTP